MYHAEEWYKQYEMKYGATNRTVYLATDDPLLLHEAKKR